MRPNSTIKVVHPYAWLWQALEDDPTFVLRAMFGSKAAYVGGKLALCFSAHEEPWRGVLVCTDRTHHGSLIRDFPALAPHPILPKWLYLPEAVDAFESTAQKLVRFVQQHDPRIGVEPHVRKRTKRRQAIGRTASPRRRNAQKAR